MCNCKNWSGRNMTVTLTRTGNNCGCGTTRDYRNCVCDTNWNSWNNCGSSGTAWTSTRCGCGTWNNGTWNGTAGHYHGHCVCEFD